MKHRVFILIYIVILIICSALCIVGINRDGGELAEIYVKGELLHKIDLSHVPSSYEIELKSDENINIVLVEKGRISVTDASCPDKLCAKQGAITSSTYPIVCLPNEVIIKIRGSHDSSAPDAISK